MDFSPVGRVCSFCGTVGTRKTKFAGGLGAMMCRDCVEYYHDAFASKKRLAAISRPPWGEMSDADLLGGADPHRRDLRTGGRLLPGLDQADPVPRRLVGGDRKGPGHLPAGRLGAVPGGR